MKHSLVRFAVLIAASHIAISASSVDQARACSLVENTEHVVDADEEAVDITPPEVPVLSLMYSREPAGNGCSMNGSSCSGSGSVGLGVEMAVDDRTSLGEMGYVIELAGGELPGGMRLPARPVRADYGVMWLHFSDHDQDIAFTLSVRAMDLAGNLGEPVMVEVSDGGAGGCSTGAGSGPATMIPLILALAVALRRRRDAFPA